MELGGNLLLTDAIFKFEQSGVPQMEGYRQITGPPSIPISLPPDNVTPSIIRGSPTQVILGWQRTDGGWIRPVTRNQPNRLLSKALGAGTGP